MYRPIKDYAVIGNMQTAALISSEGSIDWCCLPDFDSPAVFCHLLDTEKGGSFSVRPSGSFKASRSYLGKTNVLSTTFETTQGKASLCDFMPVFERKRGGISERPPSRIYRLLQGLAGRMDIEVELGPSFDYARRESKFHFHPQGAIVRSETASLALTSPIPLSLSSRARPTASAKVPLKEGERLWLALSYAEEGGDPRFVDSADCERELAHTLRYWDEWHRRGVYEGPYASWIERSALVLKLLTYGPTGALVAAPTTSLPEQIGGVRNWDYRFTWLRDSSLILYTLIKIGHHDESVQFLEWLETLCRCCRETPQIVYRLNGSPTLPEEMLNHLDGYRGSRPVRIGNAAAHQFQLDSYGEILNSTYLCFELMRRPISADLSTILADLANQAQRRWREPDHGIWEVRTGPRHFLHSKLLCWVAMDRAVKLASILPLPGDVTGWKRTRSEIRGAILEAGYDASVGAFTQSLGHPELDASALLIPLVGLLPPEDPRVVSTVRVIGERLTANGLVYRYLGDDGLTGHDATFTLCTFWLVENLALQGKVTEARTLFEGVTRFANDVGLISEEIDPVTGELLGNFPQGFSHLALIRSALRLAEADRKHKSERKNVRAAR